MLEYLELIESDYLNKLRVFRLTTRISKGDVHTNLVGETTILLNEEFVSPIDAYNNEDLSVMKILHTDYTDLAMNHPSYIKTNNFIIMIDIRAMMMQYKGWKNRNTQEHSGDKSVQVFVYQVLYTNLIKEMIEWGMFNRFYNPFAEPSVSKHPFSVRNYDDRVNDMMLGLYGKYKDNSKYYDEMLMLLPSLNYENMYKKLTIDYISLNGYNMWVYYLFIGSILNNLINYLGDKGIRKNKNIITDYKWLYKPVISNRYLDNVDFITVDLTKYVYNLVDETKLLIMR
jgi:hypothetical protein